jgi:hypothetical protein
MSGACDGQRSLFTVWQLLQVQNGGLLQWRPHMYRVAGGVADATPRPEPVQHDLPKKGSVAEANHPAADKREPRPPIVEDNMATCG